VYDARELFDRAGAALDKDRYDQALALYDRLLSAFPDSALVAPALFNAGLALEGMGDLDAAVARYLEVARRARGTRHGLDGHIRAGAVMAERARWGDALRVFEELLARRDLATADRIEIRARRGYVLVESGRFDDAEAALAAALELEQVGARGVEMRYFLAMAQYYLGEVARRRAEAVRLALPEEVLQRDLEAKAKLVLVAQRRFGTPSGGPTCTGPRPLATSSARCSRTCGARWCRRRCPIGCARTRARSTPARCAPSRARTWTRRARRTP
jgi:hypothetical protein